MNKLYGENPPLEHFDTYYNRVRDLIWVYAARLLELKQDVILVFGVENLETRQEQKPK